SASRPPYGRTAGPTPVSRRRRSSRARSRPRRPRPRPSRVAASRTRRWPARRDRAVAHLRDADPRLRTLIDEVGELGERSGRRGVQPHDYYGALVRAIIGQQLSSKVARVMVGRLWDRFGGRPPTPVEVLAEDPEE